MTADIRAFARSSRDPVTGLMNRCSFDEAIPGKLATASEEARALALLLMEVDQLETLSGKHGGPVGDAVLRHIAGVLRANARRRDEIFRYGEAQFAVLAHDCVGSSAKILAEGFRTAIEASPWILDGKTVKVTASIGVGCAYWPASPVTLHVLEETARLRLEDAIHGGRNTWRADADAALGRRHTGSLFLRIGRLLAI